MKGLTDLKLMRTLLFLSHKNDFSISRVHSAAFKETGSSAARFTGGLLTLFSSLFHEHFYISNCIIIFYNSTFMSKYNVFVCFVVNTDNLHPLNVICRQLLKLLNMYLWGYVSREQTWHMRTGSYTSCSGKKIRCPQWS